MHIFTPAHIDILDFLGYYIFALAQFENVFSSIDNFERAIWQPHAHVAGMVPALIVNGLSRFLGVLIVADKDVFAFHTNFALIVNSIVLHFRYIYELLSRSKEEDVFSRNSVRMKRMTSILGVP